MIIIDTGEQHNDESQNEDLNENPLALASSGFDDGSSMIYLNTLSSFTAFKAGSYALTALKKMTGTEIFLKLNDEEKKCTVERFEDCQAKRYIGRVQKECGCVPWALSSALVTKV